MPHILGILLGAIDIWRLQSHSDLSWTPQLEDVGHHCWLELSFLDLIFHFQPLLHLGDFVWEPFLVSLEAFSEDSIVVTV